MTKAEQFKELLKLTTDSLTKAEFASAFKSLMELVKKIEQALIQKIDTKLSQALVSLQELNQTYRETIAQIKEDNQSTLSNLKRWVLEKVGEVFIKSEINKSLTDRLGRVDQKLAEFDAYEPPDAATITLEATNRALEAVKSLIPIIPNTKEEISNAGDIIATALEKLPEETKLKIDAVKNLRQELDELKKMKGTIHLGGSSLGGHIVKAEDITSQLNGVLKTFTLPAFWRVISIHSSSFPFSFRPTTDYTTDAAANSITFTSEISADTMLATNTTITVVYSEP